MIRGILLEMIEGMIFSVVGIYEISKNWNIYQEAWVFNTRTALSLPQVILQVHGIHIFQYAGTNWLSCAVLSEA